MHWGIVVALLGAFVPVAVSIGILAGVDGSRSHFLKDNSNNRVLHFTTGLGVRANDCWLTWSAVKMPRLRLVRLQV